MIKQTINRVKDFARNAADKLPVTAIVRPAVIKEDDIDYLTIKRQEEHVYGNENTGADETTRRIWVVEGKLGKVIHSLDTTWTQDGDVHIEEQLVVLSRTATEPTTTVKPETALNPALRTEHVSLVLPALAEIYVAELRGK